MLRGIGVLLLTLIIGSSLSGCVGLLAGGAVAGGALVGFDRRSTGAQADDQAIEMKVSSQIRSKINGDRSEGQEKAHVSVVSYNRAVLVVGEVPNQTIAEYVERLVRAQPNVRAVYNHLETAKLPRTLSERSSDTWVTSKVRTNLMGAGGFSPNQVKVVTVGGVVYVFGILTPEEEAAVVKVISQSAGVQRVVTLFETFEAK